MGKHFATVHEREGKVEEAIVLVRKFQIDEKCEIESFQDFLFIECMRNLFTSNDFIFADDFHGKKFAIG